MAATMQSGCDAEDIGKYAFRRALRPFSFPVALITCMIGILLAALQGPINPFAALLVLAGGLLLQAGVNLINDHADIRLLQGRPENAAAITAIRHNFKSGMLCFLLASAIGLHFVIQQGMGFLLLCVLGLAGALGYTVSPVNYKSRGLGVVLVFWLMGVLMMAGSALALGASLTPELLLQTVPVSLLVSLLLLSNELRDCERDRRDGLHTLTVRMGYAAGVRLYLSLLAGVYLVSALLLGLGLLPGALWLLPSLLLTLKPVRLLRVDADARQPLTPATARLLLGFGMLFCLALLNPWPIML
ncbi:prenyltransferase [Marinobacterium weihaiense]|uniref:Prenyltransferase n=1 Tax=Marinobacterium weihaiense TaxID=2851016 RepID=A0ABS6MB84_9GAMM|nr:prenyltransferase [Marinobacterium weihaiense]MBV0933101.1 prenyltransferase [Marinobacterium weihaiense]